MVHLPSTKVMIAWQRKSRYRPEPIGSRLSFVLMQRIRRNRYPTPSIGPLRPTRNAPFEELLNHCLHQNQY